MNELFFVTLFLVPPQDLGDLVGKLGGESAQERDESEAAPVRAGKEAEKLLMEAEGRIDEHLERGPLTLARPWNPCARFRVHYGVSLFVMLASCLGQDSEEIAKLIDALDADEIQSRDKATAQLIEIGEPALGALKKASEHGSAETRARARYIVQLIEIGPHIRDLASKDASTRGRAMEGLVQAGEPAVKKLREALSHGSLAEQVAKVWNGTDGLVVGFGFKQTRVTQGTRVSAQILWINAGKKKVGVARFTGVDGWEKNNTKKMIANYLEENCTHRHIGLEDCVAFELEPGEVRSNEVSIHKSDELPAGAFVFRVGQSCNGVRTFSNLVALTIESK